MIVSIFESEAFYAAISQIVITVIVVIVRTKRGNNKVVKTLNEVINNFIKKINRNDKMQDEKIDNLTNLFMEWKPQMDDMNKFLEKWNVKTDLKTRLENSARRFVSETDGLSPEIKSLLLRGRDSFITMGHLLIHNEKINTIESIEDEANSLKNDLKMNAECLLPEIVKKVADIQEAKDVYNSMIRVLRDIQTGRYNGHRYPKLIDALEDYMIQIFRIIVTIWRKI